MIFINGAAVAWGDAGIRKQDIEPGTGYHVPEGSLAVFCERMRGDDGCGGGLERRDGL